MRFSKVTLFVCAIFLIFLPSGIRAQTAVCDGIADSGERLKCKHGKLLDAQDRMITNLQSHFGQVIPAENFERMKKAHGRATKAKDRMTSKHFQSLAKKNPEECAIAEYMGPGANGDGDGICEPGELCAEVINDNIGDNDGICKMKGKNREVCVEICGGNNTMEDDVDPGVLQDLEQNYDDMTQGLEEANNALGTAPLMASMGGSLLTASAPADACKASIDGLAIAEALATTIMKLNSTSTRGAADMAGAACGQDVAGFNVAATCVAVEGVAMVHALLADVVEGGFRVAKAFTVDSTKTCLSSLSADLQDTKTTLGTVASTTSDSSGQLNAVVINVHDIKITVNNLTTNLNALSATVNALQQRIADLSATMNSRFDKVETILNTPPGRRDNFPK